MIGIVDRSVLPTCTLYCPQQGAIIFQREHQLRSCECVLCKTGYQCYDIMWLEQIELHAAQWRIEAPLPTLKLQARLVGSDDQDDHTLSRRPFRTVRRLSYSYLGMELVDDPWYMEVFYEISHLRHCLQPSSVS